MSWTAEDLATLDAAILQGGTVRSLSFQDQSVSFASLDEMLRLREIIAGSLVPAGSTPANYRFAATNKGV